MARTYTYTARSADNPERVVTFTLRDARMSVGIGAPLEHLERVIELGRGPEEQRDEEGLGDGTQTETVETEQPKLWLRPVAVSLVERGTRPVHVDDVILSLTDEWLTVRAWVRAGGLRLLPITLIDGRVDNPVAAEDFVAEVGERKTMTGLNLLGLLDYWGTWIAAGLAALVVLQVSRRKGTEKGDEQSS